MTFLDLDSLIAEIDRTCPSAAWPARLTAAADMAARLRQLGDELITEYVEHARFNGHSWVEIGTALGVSRQAVQQRFVGPLATVDADRLTAELRRAMDAIKRQAVQHRHNYIGTEHVLLGLLAEANTATRLIERLGADTGRIAAELAPRLVMGASQATERIPWTPYARRALATAQEAAAGREPPLITCQDVLVGLLRLGRGLAAETLGANGISLDAVESRSAAAREEGPPHRSRVGARDR
jgi:hypothetical protein